MTFSEQPHPSSPAPAASRPDAGCRRPFSFGVRRYAAHGLRRLFVPQKSLMFPVFEPTTERPRAILRIVSSCA